MFFHSDSRPGLKSKVSNKCFGREITQKRLCRLVLSQVEAAILWLRRLRDKTNLRQSSHASTSEYEDYASRKKNS